MYHLIAVRIKEWEAYDIMTVLDSYDLLCSNVDLHLDGTFRVYTSDDFQLGSLETITTPYKFETINKSNITAPVCAVGLSCAISVCHLCHLYRCQSCMCNFCDVYKCIYFAYIIFYKVSRGSLVSYQCATVVLQDLICVMRKSLQTADDMAFSEQVLTISLLLFA